MCCVLSLFAGFRSVLILFGIVGGILFYLEGLLRSRMLPLLLLASGALSLTGYISNPKQFFASWLVGFVWCTTLVLGGMFFVMIQRSRQTNARCIYGLSKSELPAL